MRLYLFYIAILSNLLVGCNSPQSPKVATQQKDSATEPAVSEVKLRTIEGRDTSLFFGINNKVRPDDRFGRASVFVFLSPECPLCQSYSLTLNEFSEKYKKNNIYFYGIFAGTVYTVDEIRDFQKKYSIMFPLLLDTALHLTHLLNATVTPEAFVVDDKANVLYSGRIDNWAYEVSKKRKIITEHNLQDALDCIVSNTPISNRKTEAVGCFIESPAK